MSSLTAFLTGCGDLLNLCPPAPGPVRTRAVLPVAEAWRHDQQALRADADRVMDALEHDRPELQRARRELTRATATVLRTG